MPHYAEHYAFLNIFDSHTGELFEEHAALAEIIIAGFKHVKYDKKKKKKIGFGIIGTGSISHIHATAIKAIEEADLIGAFNIHYEKAKIFCDRFGCIAYHSIEDMLNNPKIDIVCICTPSGIHLDPALLTIAAGKHCLIEKPLEISTKRCTEIIEAADKKGVRIGTIYPSRFLESNIELKKAH